MSERKLLQPHVCATRYRLSTGQLPRADATMGESLGGRLGEEFERPAHVVRRVRNGGNFGVAETGVTTTYGMCKGGTVYDAARVLQLAAGV